MEFPLVVCVAPGCTNNNANTKNVRFHRFPVSQTAKFWLAALGYNAPPSSGLQTVCSKHFRKQDYLEDHSLAAFKDFKTHRTLKPEAVPSLFIGGTMLKTTEEEEDEDYEETAATKRKAQRPRVDKALGQLTQMFMKALNTSSNGVLDLNDVARQLKAPKRRVYDITNVLQGISLITKISKNTVQWVGWPEEFFNDGLRSLIAEEKKLDESIRNAKQLIQEMYENQLNSRLAYLTYEDIQSLPIFEDQAVFVIRAPSETKLEVAHPKEAFQIHINSTKGPVEVLVCTDNSDVLPKRRQRPPFADGDYSYFPFQGLSTVSCNDNANHNNAKSSTSTTSPPEPSPHLSQPLDTTPKSTPFSPPQEGQLNFIPPSPPVSVSIKEEMTDLIITPDEPMNLTEHKPELLTTDVQMTDLS